MSSWRALLWMGCIVCAMSGCAQPQYPDLSFTVVRNAKGQALKGPYAENSEFRVIKSDRRKKAWTVEMHFTVSKDYAYSNAEIGQHKQWPLAGSPIPGDRHGRMAFTVLDCWCTDQYVVITQGAEVMRIDLPDPGKERSALHEQVMARSGFEPSPEVIRFRPGRFTYAELANDPHFDELEQYFAQGIKRAGEALHKEQLADQEKYHRDHPLPEATPAPYVEPLVITEAQRSAFWAEQPPLKEVRTDSVHSDTVWLSITGRIMLDGGCASNMPLFGLEMRTDGGWETRIPFEFLQMDCGLPWGDWVDRSILLPLRTWVRSRSQDKELLPGTYRLVFSGGDMQEFRTSALEVTE